jgi:hypothetical protein
LSISIAVYTITDVFLILKLFNIDHHIRTILKIFLHFEPKILMKSPEVMKVIAGDFSQGKDLEHQRKQEFFGESLIYFLIQ